MNTVYNLVALIWRIPGFLFSLVFYRSTRLVILSAAKRIFNKKLQSGERLTWTAYSESLNIPGALPYMMCTTSRWNPHAPLGSFGPFNVASHIEVDLDSARRSARGWIITVFHGDFEVAALVFPGNSGNEAWRRIDLPPNQYRILVRYYGYNDETVFPAVKVDGVELTAARNVGNEMQKSLDFFADNVVGHRGFFYFLTQYYIFQLLRWKQLLPPALVRRLYLPVGDPQITSYRYGIIKKGACLHIQFDERLLGAADVYVTYCNRWGFPMFWDHVNQGVFTSRAVPEDVVYLVRVVNFRNEEQLELERFGFSDSVLSPESAVALSEKELA